MENIVLNFFILFIVAIVVSNLLTILYFSKACNFFHNKVDAICDKIAEMLYVKYFQKRHTQKK